MGSIDPVKSPVPTAESSMSGRRMLLIGGVSVAIVGAVLTVLLLSVAALYQWGDANRRENVRRAYVVRSLGKAVYEGYSHAFEHGPYGSTACPECVAAYPQTFEGKAFLGGLAAVGSSDIPTFFGDHERTYSLVAASKSYRDLLAQPRGSWMSYQNELGLARTRFESSLDEMEIRHPNARLRDEAITFAEKAISEYRTAAETLRSTQEQVNATGSDAAKLSMERLLSIKR